jgi:hypothetical protein
MANNPPRYLIINFKNSGEKRIINLSEVTEIKTSVFTLAVRMQKGIPTTVYKIIFNFSSGTKHHSELKFSSKAQMEEEFLKIEKSITKFDSPVVSISINDQVKENSFKEDLKKDKVYGKGINNKDEEEDEDDSPKYDRENTTTPLNKKNNKKSKSVVTEDDDMVEDEKKSAKTTPKKKSRL